MGAAGIHRLLAAAVVVLALAVATSSAAREVPGGGRYELEEEQRVSTQHDVPSGPNPGSNLSPRLPPSEHGVVTDGGGSGGGHHYLELKQQQQQHVSIQHDVPSGPNPGSNLSPRLPPSEQHGGVVAAASTTPAARDQLPARVGSGVHYYEVEKKQQHVSTQHDVPGGPNPDSNLSPRLSPRPYDDDDDAVDDAASASSLLADGGEQ